jgi:spore maturation protein CgeB
MRILILDTHYDDALRLVYESREDLDRSSFEEQVSAIYDFGFGRADALPLNLGKLGHDARQFVMNAAPAQLQWAAENGVRLPLGRSQRMKLKRLWNGAAARLWPRPSAPGFNVPSWQMKVIAAQAQAFRPDVIFICDVLYLPASFISELKNFTRLLVGEMAYPIPPGLDLRPFDLIVSAAPHYVDRLRATGVQSDLLRLGFESTILDRLEPQPKTDAVVFIGSVGKDHRQRVQLLETLIQHVPLSCFGSGAGSLPPDSPLRDKVGPPLWGYEMYRQLQRARIALNIHIDMAENFAANMRLYEATGVGTMLVTDWKQNLDELFKSGTEVIAYRSPEECIESIKHYLDHDQEREQLAQLGQRRTLSEHTYYHRMQELTEILRDHLHRKSQARVAAQHIS